MIFHYVYNIIYPLKTNKVYSNSQLLKRCHEIKVNKFLRMEFKVLMSKHIQLKCYNYFNQNKILSIQHIYGSFKKRKFPNDYAVTQYNLTNFVLAS